jgi:hypothetical protein
MMSVAAVPARPVALRVDAKQVEHALRVLVPEGETFELRAIHSERGFESIHSGYFSDPAIAAAYVARYDSRSIVGFYVTLNPVEPSLRARRSDRMEKVGKDATTKDHHTRYRRRLLIDADAVRPTGISASDAEHAAALQLIDDIRKDLLELRWPSPIVADSGNGGHLIFGVDLPADDDGLVERFLKAADQRWGRSIGGVVVKVDISNSNPSRITKLYGTPARKGDDVPERPHRLSTVIDTPSVLEAVTREQLELFIASVHTAPEDAKAAPHKSEASERIDAVAWLAKHGYTVIDTSPYRGRKGNGTLLELSSCPYNPEHGERGEAHLIQFESGAIIAGCHHATCKAAGWGWSWLREKHEGKKRKKAKGDGAVQVARDYVAKNATHPAGALLRRWRGDFYRWDPTVGCYVQQSDEQIDADLYRKMGLTKRSDVGDVRHALIAVDDVLIDHAELGTWLDSDHEEKPLEVAACRNGILHLPTRELTPATPRYFATTALGVAFEPAPTPPRVWLHFLKQLWPHDEESIALLQEWMGYLLTPDTRLQKILLLIGPKRSGKGTIARTISALLGAGSVASPTLASLGANFGLWPLIGKSAAIIGDARLGARNDVSQVVERLLSISGEDLQTIDRKHREPRWAARRPCKAAMSSESSKRRRGPGRPWPKGVSGNPAGRPRTGLALAESVREQADPDEMSARALKIMRGDNDTLALAALTWLRDSGFLKPPTTSALQITNGAERSYAHLSDERLTALLAEVRGEKSSDEDDKSGENAQ